MLPADSSGVKMLANDGARFKVMIEGKWSVVGNSGDGTDGGSYASSRAELIEVEVYDVLSSGLECMAYEWRVAGVGVGRHVEGPG